MRIGRRTLGSVVVVELRGSLSLGCGPARVREVVAGLLRRRHAGIVVDLRRIDRLDCSGIGELAVSHRIVVRAGGELAFVGLREEHRRMLNAVDLLSVLDVYASEDLALARFIEEPDREVCLHRLSLRLEPRCEPGPTPTVRR